MSESQPVVEIVKICKVHGGLTRSEVYIKKDLKMRFKYRFLCKKCALEGKKKYNKNYRDLKRNDESFHIKARKSRMEWQINNLDKSRLLSSKTQKKRVYNLVDSYVRTRLLARSILKYKDIPKELIELKRLAMMLKRAIKEYKNG